MKSVAAVAFLLAFTASVVAQRDLCSELLSPSNWVINKNIARRVGDCATMYVCSGQQEPLPKGQCSPGTFYSLSLGVCAFNNMEILKLYFGMSTCEEEDREYGPRTLEGRRRTACEQFKSRNPQSDTQTVLYAADPEDCRRYFSCWPETVNEWFHKCTTGTYFSSADGFCISDPGDGSVCA